MSDPEREETAGPRLKAFAERERAFEAKFVHDEELKFLTVTRRDKLFALWAAERLGVSGARRDALIRDLLAVQGHPRHDDALLRFAVDALAAAGARAAAHDAPAALERLGREAREQLLYGEAQPIDLSSH